jgi:uncharacterized repeat protein (TIGR01451 family)
VATYIWNGSTFVYGTLGNWIGGGVPGAGDTAVFAAGGDFTPTLSAPYEAARWEFSNVAQYYQIGGDPIDLSEGLFNSSNEPLILNLTISGTGGITQKGGSYVFLTSSNSFTGDLTIESGSVYAFNGAAIPDTGKVVVTNGSLLVQTSETIGSLNGGGGVSIQSSTLTIAGAAPSTYSGVISNNGSLTLTGSTLTLSGPNTYTGPTLVSGGSLFVNGSIASSLTTVKSGATLGGSGTTKAVTVESGGALSPGNSPGTLTVNGNMTLNSGSAVNVEIGDTSVGEHDKIIVNGTVALNGATLNLLPYQGRTAAANAPFKIIDNDGTSDAVVGTFSGLAEGALATVGGYTVKISYVGGDGNDVTLTREAADVAVTVADSPDPVRDGDNLTYTITVTNSGISAENVSLSNTLPAGTTFVSLTQGSGPAFSATTPAVGAGGTVTATIGSLAAGATATFGLSVAVTAGTTAGTVVSNTATVTTTTQDFDGSNNTGTAVTTTTVAPTYTIAASADMLEGDSGGGNTITYTVSRTGDASQLGKVTVALSGLATSGDYAVTGLSGTDGNELTVPAGQSSATFTVTTAPDVAVEPNETVVATLTGVVAGGGTVNATPATANILNDDSAFSIAASAASVVEGNAAPGNQLTYTVTRTGNLGQAGSVTVGFSGTATEGTDYTITGLTGGALSFAPNQTTAQITVTTVPDTSFEANETVVATLSAPTVGTITTVQATATISNDDAAPPSDPDPTPPTPPGPTAGSDSITGTSGNDVVSAGFGDDTVAGGDGSDLIYGNQGNDVLEGGSGTDTLFGGQGSDTVMAGDGGDLVYGNLASDLIYGNLGEDTVFGGQGEDTVFGGQGQDLVYGNLGNDVAYGNLGNDQVYGGQGLDTLYGGQGADQVYGNFGDDQLFGNLGDDQLYGGQGNDVLTGGAGNDLLQGGLGADTYVFDVNSGADQINGFDQASGDRLSLSGQTYTLGNSSDGDVLLLLSGGGTLELNGITQAQFSPGFVA